MAPPRRRKNPPRHDPARATHGGRRSEDHFRQLVEGVVDHAILLLDPEGRIATWNGGAERITGYAADEILGEPSERFYTPEARDEGVPARHLAEAVSTGRVSEEGWCLRKDGTRFWAGVTITAVVGAGGAPRCFLIIAQDLTGRREMEQQLRLAVEASKREAELRLHESEERFSRFAQHLPGLAWIKDLEGRYVYINEAGARAFNRPRHEVHGATDAELFPPETAARFRENDRLAIRRRTAIEAVEELTYPDGTVHHSIVSKFPILDSHGQIQLVGGVAIDITERVRAEEALLQADRRKDEFLATLSHELRNPLAPLRNSLHVLRARGGEPRTARMYQMMEQQLNRMIRLVDDLLEVSRITGGKVELRKERVLISQIVESAVETSRPLMESAGHRLTLNLPAEPLVLDADPMRMAQVISNLLNNAAKYTPEGGQIVLSVARDEASAVVSIRDNGLGIPAAMLPRVFEMFAQVDRTLKRAQGGLGIGLALARSLVEMHGGRIEAHSAGLNQGSQFVVRIPLGSGVPESPATTPSERRPAPANPRPRVLVVDDSRDGADSLALVLQTLGAEAKVAYDGPSALSIAREFSPSVVLLDLGMPGMDGYETAARLQAEPTLKGMQLVALTGFGSEEDQQRSQEAGFAAHFVKPVDPARLRTLLVTKPESAA